MTLRLLLRKLNNTARTPFQAVDKVELARDARRHDDDMHDRGMNRRDDRKAPLAGLRLLLPPASQHLTTHMLHNVSQRLTTLRRTLAGRAA